MHVQEQALSPKEEADRMEDEKQAAKLLSAALLGCDTRQKKIPTLEAERVKDEKQAAKLLSAALLGCDTRQNVADTLHCEKAFVCKMCV